MKDLSLIIPCYNEESNIPLIVKRCQEIIPDNLDIEIILVNNGSKDKTRSVIQEEIQRATKKVFVLCDVVKNIGYGHGILSGLSESEGKVLAWTHADMQTDPEDVIKAYSLYKANNSETVLIKGRRKKRALGPNLFTWGMTIIASLALREELTDIGAQPKLFSRNFYEKHLREEAPKDFSLDLYAMYQAKKTGRILTFPVYFANRAFGEAKGGGSLMTRIRVTKRVLSFIFELRKKIRSK